MQLHLPLRGALAALSVLPDEPLCLLLQRLFHLGWLFVHRRLTFPSSTT